MCIRDSSSLDIRIAHHDLAVEAARTHQGGIKNIRAVGGRDHDDALVGAEAVHFHKQLVERLLPLVMASAEARAALAAHRVDFVDKDDARRILFRLLKQVAHAGGAHAHEHLNKVGTGDGEEGNARFPRHRTGQEGFTGTGRAHHCLLYTSRCV